MDKNELMLKTLFCCSACDGDIATEEVDLVKQLVKNNSIFNGLDVESLLNGYISEINGKGKLFLKEYLNSLSEMELSDEDQITLMKLAIDMIEADNQILYAEVKFFKKIRAQLLILDENIPEELLDKEDYFMPDTATNDKDLDWGDITFAPINFSLTEEAK